MPTWRMNEVKMQNGESDPVNRMENFQLVKALDIIPK
jgi:hypothetical protein